MSNRCTGRNPRNVELTPEFVELGAHVDIAGRCGGLEPSIEEADALTRSAGVQC